MPFTRVNPGDLIQAQNLDQVIDSLNGVSGKGVPIAQTSVNDATNYALTVQNDEATNSRALNVLKSDGSVLIRADVTGVTLGSPLNLPANSITSTAIADGGIQNVDLGPDVARANMLSNPGFEWWQRGNGPFTVGAGAFCADRWALSIGASSTLSVSRVAGNGSPYAAGITYTHTNQTQMIQKIEQVGQLVGKTVTFSVDVQANVAGAARVLVWDALGPLNYSSYHPGGGAWQRMTSSCAVASNATQVQVYIEFDATVTGACDNAMLVVGSQPANYVPLHPADDLARCLRYYEQGNPAAEGPYFAAGQAASATAVYAPFFYRVQKAVAPTVTCSAPANFSVTNAAFSPIAITGISPNFVTRVSCRLDMPTTGMTSGNASLLQAANGNAQISVEANP
ncbi:MAG TPA: hypothetical protein VFB50_01430 [Chloroflexota bacterium]|nr:hypothetical protein [Chloroflexota bacterium]